MNPDLFFVALLPAIALLCAVLVMLDNPFDRPYVPVLSFSAINGAVESSADVLYSAMAGADDIPTGGATFGPSAPKPSTPEAVEVLSRRTAAGMLSVLTGADVEALFDDLCVESAMIFEVDGRLFTPQTNGTVTVTEAPTPEAVEVDDARIECLASDLLTVLDRVETPVTVEADNGLLAGRLATGETTMFSVSVATRGWDSDIILEDENGVRVATVSGGLMVDVLSPTVLDAPADVVAYVGDGELLCADHGAPFDIGVSDGSVSPILRDNGSNLDAVEYCSHFDGDGPHGHSFCGSCGFDVEVNSPLSTCSNCSTHAVYVDDTGWQYVEDHADLPPCAVTRFADTASVQYVETALWSTSATRTDDESEEPEPLDSWADIDDIDADTVKDMRADVLRFVAEVWADVESMDAAQVGHDFWLTRERHGAGFRDRGLGEVGDRLTDAAHAYGGFDLYVGDDGRIYG